MASRYCVFQISIDHQISNPDGCRESMRGSFDSLKVEEVMDYLNEVLTYYEMDNASKDEIRSDMESFFAHTPWANADELWYTVDKTDTLKIKAEKIWKEY